MPGTGDVAGFAESFFRFGPYFLVVLLIATGVGLLINSQPDWLDKRKRFWLSVGFFAASAVVSVMALWDWGRARQSEVVAQAEAQAKRIVADAEAEANQIRAAARQDADRWFVRRIQVSLGGAEVAVRGIGLPQTAVDDYRAVWQISAGDWRLEVTIFGRFPVTDRHLPIVYVELEEPVAHARVALPLCLSHVTRADRIEIVVPMRAGGVPTQIGPSLRVLAGGAELRPETCLTGA
jgi:membrane protein implicated in regulation of membrane protease activity